MSLRRCEAWKSLRSLQLRDRKSAFPRGSRPSVRQCQETKGYYRQNQSQSLVLYREVNDDEVGTRRHMYVVRAFLEARLRVPGVGIAPLCTLIVDVQEHATLYPRVTHTCIGDVPRRWTRVEK